MKKLVLATSLVAVAICACGIIVFGGERHERRDDAPPRHERERDRGDVADILDAVARMIPELGELLKELRVSEPEEFRETVRRASDIIRDLSQLRHRNKRHFEVRIKDERLEATCRLIGRKYHRADDEDERKKLKEQLKKTLTDLFDHRLSRMKAESDELKRELKRIEKLIKAREKSREGLIERRLDRMTGVVEVEEW